MLHTQAYVPAKVEGCVFGDIPSWSAVFPQTQFARQKAHRYNIRVTIVTLSPKYQVVIPKEIRRKLKMEPGQKLAVLEQGGQVHLVPVLSIDELRGRWPGIQKGWERDEEDRV